MFEAIERKRKRSQVQKAPVLVMGLRHTGGGGIRERDQHVLIEEFKTLKYIYSEINGHHYQAP